jgi:hypothetical protein
VFATRRSPAQRTPAGVAALRAARWLITPKRPGATCGAGEEYQEKYGPHGLSGLGYCSAVSGLSHNAVSGLSGNAVSGFSNNAVFDLRLDLDMGIYYMRFPTSEAGGAVSEREGKCGPREGRGARPPRGKRSAASGHRGTPVEAQKPSRSSRAQCSKRERIRSKKKGLLLALQYKHKLGPSGAGFRDAQ